MENTEKGQITKNAAEIYEEFFIPALFQEWTERVSVAAQIETGDKVLDVACGTGVLARFVYEKVGESGSVVGVDINDGMLAVAESKNPNIEWRRSAAEKLPFEENTFEKVVSQFGLMFFEDRTEALREMARVLKPNGILAVAVWDSLETSPGYAEMTELLRRLFGEKIASALEAPFVLGDKKILSELFAEAGMENAEIKTMIGKARFPSIESWVHTDIKGWTLAEAIDDKMYQSLLDEAQNTLKKFTDDKGKVAFDAPAHIVTWRKPE
jgi:ubiquinone/menaquinone biosynthesis C-methylase UbiE